MTRMTQRGFASLSRNPKMSSHKGTEITEKSAAEIASYLRGFVVLCENQTFVLQGFAAMQNLRKKKRFERVAIRMEEEPSRQIRAMGVIRG